MAKKEEALTKQEPAAMVVHDYGEFAGTGSALGAGYENQDQHDVKVPFLNILQAQSPSVVHCEDNSLRAGMIINTVTKETWENPKGVLFTAGTTNRLFTKFTPRDAGGGFKGNFSPDDPMVLAAIAKAKEQKLDFGEYYADDGDELVETFYVYGAYGDEEGNALGMAICGFASASIKHYKNWMGVLRAHTTLVRTPSGNMEKKNPPLFAHLCRLTTFLDKNTKGAWWAPRLNPARGSVEQSLLSTNSSMFQMAWSCGQLINSGQAKIDYNAGRGENGGGTQKADVPF